MSTPTATTHIYTLLCLWVIFCWLPTANAQDSKALKPDFVSEDMAEDVQERIDESLSDYRDEVSNLEQRLKEFAEENFKASTYTVKGVDKPFKNMPRKHPLLETQKKGVADSSKEDYTKKDTRVLFNKETFGQCLEEREIRSGPYVEECRKRCPTGLRTFVEGNPQASCLPCKKDPRNPKAVLCKNNQFYVSEMYWPVYQSRTYPGRAMGSFDPNGDYLASEDTKGRGNLEFDKVREEYYDKGKQQFIDAMKEYYGKTITDAEFEAALPKKLWEAADYTGRDVHTGGGGLSDVQPMHTLVYMTNANRQLSRRFRPGRKDFWKGYIEEDRCFFNTLPDPKKLAVSHASYSPEHSKFSFAYNHKEIDEPNEIGPKRGTPYGYAMLDEGPKVADLMRSVDREWRANSQKQPASTNNFMLGGYIEMNGKYFEKGMQRVGVSYATHWQDWLYHSFFRLYHSRNNNQMKDPLYAAIVSGFSFYTLNSLDTFGPNMEDDGLRKPIFWSFYAGRPGRDGENYAGDKKVGPGKIFSVDKIQVLYPTLDKDGTRGSHCFKPESLASSAYYDVDKETIDDQIGTQGFWGFRRDLRKRLLEDGIKDAHNYVREVRIAYWVKRVNCHCTVCSRNFYGCSVLNTGDHPDDNFYGTTALENQDPYLFDGGDLIVNETRGIPIQTQIARGASVARSLGTSIATGLSAESESPVRLTLISDHPQEDRGSIFGNRFNQNVYANRNKKEQSPKNEANARKIGLKNYGQHAEDDDAAAPQDEGNGDEYELGQVGPDSGTPGTDGTEASNDPLEGNDDANDTPVDVPAPQGSPPNILQQILPPLLTLIPLVCEEAKEKNENGGGECSGQRSLVYKCGASGSCSSGGGQGGGCGGESGGDDEKKQELLQQILGGLIGQLLGNLLSGGGGGGGGSQQGQTQEAVAENEILEDSGSQSANQGSGNDSHDSQESSEEEDENLVQDTEDTAIVAKGRKRRVKWHHGNKDNSDYVSGNARFFGSRAQLGGAGQRSLFGANNSAGPLRTSRRLSQRLQKHFAQYSSPKEVTLRSFNHNQRLGFVMVNRKRYELTRSFGNSFACLGPVCDYELAAVGTAGIASRRKKSVFRVCELTSKRAQKFRCWNNEKGLIRLGKELLRDATITKAEKSEIFLRSLVAFDPRFTRGGNPRIAKGTGYQVCIPGQGCTTYVPYLPPKVASPAATSEAPGDSKNTDSATSEEEDEDKSEDDSNDEQPAPDSQCAQPKQYINPETGEIISEEELKDKQQSGSG